MTSNQVLSDVTADFKKIVCVIINKAVTLIN
jgi:hypothetical protein